VFAVISVCLCSVVRCTLLLILYAMGSCICFFTSSNCIASFVYWCMFTVYYGSYVDWGFVDCNGCMQVRCFRVGVVVFMFVLILYAGNNVDSVHYFFCFIGSHCNIA
jgi:hypothetical protein